VPAKKSSTTRKTRSSPRKQFTRGERVCAFLEKYCKVPSGDMLPVGSPMKLEAFQRKFILEIYDNPLGTRRAYLSIARKNGKTALIAAIVLAHVAGPEAKRNTQIISGAQSREQAAIVFDLASKMVQMSPELSRVIRIIPSSKRLVGLVMNTDYRAISAEGKTAHGLSPVLAILDEVGQVKGPRDEFVSAITTSQGAYRDSLLIAISTQAPTDADLFSLWLDGPDDPRVVRHVYAAPADCALDDRAGWFAANPGLAKFKSLDDLEHGCKLALEMPASEAEFRNYSLNQRVEASNPFVSKSVWMANGAQPAPMQGKKWYAGLDLSSVADLTALVMVSEDGDVHCAFWLPAEGLVEKSRADHVPYDLWAQQGHLLTTPGRAIEYEHVAEHLRGLFDACTIEKLAFDRYLLNFLRPWLIKVGFTDSELERFVEFGQGTQSMTPALRELEAKLLNTQLKHGNNPILETCARNAKVVGDSGARKFDKKRARGRIDGMVALAMAVGVMPTSEQQPEYRILFV
jgi:phage terminase large subunit-like protein